jgi:hypothetical protein
MEDNHKQKMEDDLKKMEDDLKKNMECNHNHLVEKINFNRL